MNNLLNEAFHHETFRTQGHALVDLLADHLQQSISGSTKQSQQWASPEERLAFWEADFASNDFDLLSFAKAIIDQSLHLHHPKYVGHQVGVSVPIATLTTLVGSLLNNGVATYEVGQGAIAIERIVIQELLQYFGWKNGDGVLTSGGTLGNLTALLTARNIQMQEVNHQETTQLALLVSEESHYCIDRAVRTMGWGEKGIIKVPTNDHFQMRTNLLPELLKKAQQNGQHVIAIVGSACTTSSGSFDDLEAIADFCEANNLWFHVDGAHGASAIFSESHRSLIKGIERADSFIMDFHKMLLIPSLTTAVFYKNANQSYATFAQKAQYLWQNQEELEWFHLGKRTFECTKLMMSLRVYAVMKAHGVQLWSDYVYKMFDLGRKFGELIQETPHFELATLPSCNIVCFRYTNCRDIELNKCNAFLRQHILEQEEFYMVQTTLRGDLYLRTTLMNPFTSLEDLKQLLERIKEGASLWEK